MNPPRVSPEDYIQFLLATPKASTCAEAARVQPDRPAAPAHDAFRRLLHLLEPAPDALWAEVAPLVDRSRGVLVIDDTTLDKPHSHHIQLVTRHWSGKHYQVVSGINLISLVWTDGDRLYPTDYRIYHKTSDGKTKNDHFRDLLATARARGLAPRRVLFDSWYAGLENFTQVRRYGWVFLGRILGNRLVRLDHGEPAPIERLPVAEAGTVVWLPGFGLVKVFEKVDGTIPNWAAFVPFYNLYLLVTKVAGKEPVWCLVALIPVAGMILLSVEVAKKFGKDTPFAIGMGLVPFVFYPLLGTSDARYQTVPVGVERGA
jgi:hypothetical protein